MWTIVICILLATAVANGLLFDDPCNVGPRDGIQPADSVTDVNVPPSCTNGTFWWNYPQGTVLLHFPNEKQVPTTVCIRDSLGGRVFTVTDKTNNKRLRHFNHRRWACTDPASVLDVVLQIVAPSELRYMGALNYRVSR